MFANLKVAIITPDYPSPSRYSFSFVHARARQYLLRGIEVAVFVISKEKREYTFENIHVVKYDTRTILKKITAFAPSVLAVHYPLYYMISLANRIQLPTVAWIHGHEVQWYLRLTSSENFLQYLKKRAVLIPREIYQMSAVRQFTENVQFSVFISGWMLKTAERHTLSRYTNHVIIPNPVDTELFSYYKPDPKNINAGIALKNLNNSKYGLDVAIKAFAHLREAHLDIIGKGRLGDAYARLAARTGSNSRILEQSIPHHEIPELYRSYGFYVAPSRSESQGLSMCEAMSCGLPVIATTVGGIPEFVRDGVDGYLVPPDDPEELRKAVLRLLSDRDAYYQMSRNAHEHINNVCSAKAVIDKEIDVLTKAIEKYHDG